MELSTKKILTALVAIVLLSACNMTQKYHEQPFKEAGYSALPVSLTVNKNFRDVQSQIKQKLVATNVVHEESTIQTSSGSINVLRINMPYWFWHDRVINDDSLLSLVIERSCEGEVSRGVATRNQIEMQWEDLFYNKRIDPVLTGMNNDSFELYRKHRRGGASLFGGRNKASGMPSTKILPDLLAPIEDDWKQQEDLDFVHTGHNIYICTVDSKVQSALLLTQLYQSFHPNGAKKNGFYSVYYPAEVLNEMIIKDIDRLSAWAAKSEGNRIAYEAARERKQNKVDAINQVNAEVWQNRLNESYAIGDRVCTQDNMVGNVEQKSGNKLKVFWTQQLVEVDNFFFGEISTYQLDDATGFTKFKYDDISKYSWTDTSKVARCTIDTAN